MLKIGITGNIAAGKSEVEAIISNMGYKVFDLDRVCRDIFFKDNEIQNEIFFNFKTLDRKEIANIIFQNSEKKKVLEDILHPALYSFCLSAFRENYDIVFISGALLYEAGFDKLFDKIIFIDADYDTRLKRLIKRNALSKKEAKLRLESQSRDFKNKADFLIENNSDIEDLEKKVKETVNSLI